MKKQQALEPAQNTEWLLAAMTQPSSRLGGDGRDEEEQQRGEDCGRAD